MKYLIILILISFSCVSKGEKDKATKETVAVKETESKDYNTASLPTLDLLKSYPKKDIILQDIADVEYIPMETTNDVLFSSKNLYKTFIEGDTIVIARSEGVDFFNRKGKFLHSFDRHGGGAEEYKTLTRIGVDFKSKEVYVYDHQFNSRIYVYTFNGDFKRLLKLSDKSIWLEYLLDYDTNYLFSEDTKNVDYEGRKINNKTPYISISKKTGKVTPFPIVINKRLRNGYSLGAAIWWIPTEPITKNASEILISDFSLDTIYSLQKEILTPITVRKAQTSDAGFPLITSVDFKTNRYWCWSITEKKMNARIFNSSIPNRKFEKMKSRQILLDRKENAFYDINIINTDYLYPADLKKRSFRVATYGASLPANCAMEILSAEGLVELYNENRLQGKLKDVASKLREDDNPVLMLVKFKE